MIQQYVLLRTENDLLNSLIGKSFNQKSKFEAGRILDEIHSKAQSRMIGKKSLCYIVDKNEILGVGGSTLMKDKNGKIISNLILDQFGITLAGLFHFFSLSTKSVIVKDQTGVNRTISIYTPGRTFVAIVSGVNVGVVLQVGSGITAPARTDFKLQTPFGTAPESGNFIPADPVWSSGLGNFKVTGVIIAGGAGTINESRLATSWRDATSSQLVFTLFRDIISPGQSFIVGQTIALEYTIQL